MIVMSIVAVLCTISVAFYIRFLVALCREHKHRSICYLVCLYPVSNGCIVAEEWENETSISRAA